MMPSGRETQQQAVIQVGNVPSGGGGGKVHCVYIGMELLPVTSGLEGVIKIYTHWRLAAIQVGNGQEWGGGGGGHWREGVWKILVCIICAWGRFSP